MAAAVSGPPSPPPLERPVAIEVRDVAKTFRVPLTKVDTLRERVANPLARAQYRELHALRNVSFDVHRGEFFGIVGRNGSGKSTLLKILASIYRADAGTVRIAGRLAPFIELGVGFNPELTSRDNVTLNGVLMGLSRREARRRLDAVLDFAELREFADLKLKNYSSGMMVRLAFAVMVEADADIMLVDEVLAVGDASFAQKCIDVFRQKREAGKTIVFVTHDMASVQEFCHRAMLIHDGAVLYLGEPEEAALRYYRLNFGGSSDAAQPYNVPDVNTKLIDAWLSDDAGQRVDNVEQGADIHLDVVLEARHDLDNPEFGFHVQTAESVTVFGFNKRLGDEGGPTRVPAGQRVHVRAQIDNRLLPGRYFVQLWVTRRRTQGDFALHVLRLLDFVVYGTRPAPGAVRVDAEVSAFIEEGAG